MKEKARKLKVWEQCAQPFNLKDCQPILGGGSFVLKRRQMLSAAL
jgi:hypothetical protein